MSDERVGRQQRLYVIGEVDGHSAVKIGIADRPRSRLSQLASGNPHEMELLLDEARDHARWVEYQLHVRLRPWRLRANAEWFDVRALVLDGNWSKFIDCVLEGRLHGADPLPLPMRRGHTLAHVAGRPRRLMAVCACGWRSELGVMDRVLASFSSHAT